MSTVDPINPALTQQCTSPSSRYEAGRVQRDTVPLEAHAELAAEGKRADPLTILGQQDKSRLQEVIPLRYGRMSRTPFTYLRGAAAVMASGRAVSAVEKAPASAGVYTPVWCA